MRKYSTTSTHYILTLSNIKVEVQVIEGILGYGNVTSAKFLVAGRPSLALNFKLPFQVQFY